MRTNPPRDDSRLPRASVAVLTVAIVLTTMSGCATATAGAGAAVDASPTPTETAPTPSTSSTELAPSPEPSSSSTTTIEPEISTADLVDLCLTSVRVDNPTAAEQLDRSLVQRDDARAALRPDGDRYVVVPIDDGSVDSAVEYACLIAPGLEVTSSWGRVAPAVDDFDLWATGTEPDEGL